MSTIWREAAGLRYADATVASGFWAAAHPIADKSRSCGLRSESKAQRLSLKRGATQMRINVGSFYFSFLICIFRDTEAAFCDSVRANPPRRWRAKKRMRAFFSPGWTGIAR
ncbi:hypothetical protein [Pseudomonas huanghezhanensis]|uniref:hypothetical protein n=1 Tax=Pseudomonas huanghezhanensis TaxID=3002903 RepID=UPI0022863F81|nr:hypothetical protein [Pseudomonas sp. BSw22131]